LRPEGASGRVFVYDQMLKISCDIVVEEESPCPAAVELKGQMIGDGTADAPRLRSPVASSTASA
jgi:hypothetical protein